MKKVVYTEPAPMGRPSQREHKEYIIKNSSKLLRIATLLCLYLLLASIYIISLSIA